MPLRCASGVSSQEKMLNTCLVIPTISGCLHRLQNMFEISSIYSVPQTAICAI